MNKTVEAKVQHRFKTATAEGVFDAWLNEDDVRAWMGSALKTHGLAGDIRRIEIDPRPGGSFFFSDMRDGKEAEHWGTYQVLERPRLIEFTWFTSKKDEEEATSLVRIEIAPETEGCSVMLAHRIDAAYAEYREQTQKGWSTMLAAIERLKSTHEPVMAMNSPSFRGIFLTSRDPDKTAGFYQDVALLTLESVGEPDQYVYWKLDRGGIQIAIHDARLFADYAYPPVAESNLTHLYFKIDDLRDFRAHLDRMNVTPIAEDDVTVTVVDPDGRKVLFGTA